MVVHGRQDPIPLASSEAGARALVPDELRVSLKARSRRCAEADDGGDRRRLKRFPLHQHRAVCLVFMHDCMHLIWMAGIGRLKMLIFERNARPSRKNASS